MSKPHAFTLCLQSLTIARFECFVTCLYQGSVWQAGWLYERVGQGECKSTDVNAFCSQGYCLHSGWIELYIPN